MPLVPPLDDPSLVVQTLDKSQRDFVLLAAVGGNIVPMSFDQRGKLLERFQSLPAQRSAPLIKELPRPRLSTVVPELSELLFQNVGGVEALVRRQEGPDHRHALDSVR